jgi:hypothetical protein
MSDIFWPQSIKPLTSKSYGFSRGSNIISTPTGGGLPLMGLDLTLESVPFSLNFTLSAFELQIFNIFYDSKINHGTNSFKMLLDSGNGIQEHQCNIVPNTMKVSLPVDGTWYLALTLVAQSTSSQLGEECPNLYDLYECYGATLPCVLAALPPVYQALPDG